MIEDEKITSAYEKYRSKLIVVDESAWMNLDWYNKDWVTISIDGHFTASQLRQIADIVDEFDKEMLKVLKND